MTKKPMKKELSQQNVGEKRKRLSNFRDVAHIPLRIYNRCIVASNLMQDAGRAATEDYLDQFKKSEQIEMREMYKLIKRLGTKRVKEMVTDGLSFVDDEYVGKDLK